MTQPARPTESVGRALELLQLFRAANEGVRLVEASTALGLARSTTHRLLATLEAQRFVRRDSQTRAYYAGDALLALAASLVPDLVLRETALAEMRRIMQRTSEPTSLVVLRESMAYFVASLHRPGSRLANPRSGISLPLYSSAGGKALLSAATRAEFEVLVPTERLRTRTARTTRTELARELDDARRRGFATSFEETAAGVTAVASPITSATGHVYGAISIAARAGRVPRDELFALGRALHESCARIGARLP